jgi:hypothetical protein
MGLDEGVLGGLLGLTRVVEHRVRDPKGNLSVHVDQCSVCILVTSTRAIEEL